MYLLCSSVFCTVIFNIYDDDDDDDGRFHNQSVARISGKVVPVDTPSVGCVGWSLICTLCCTFGMGILGQGFSSISCGHLEGHSASPWQSSPDVSVLWPPFLLLFLDLSCSELPPQLVFELLTWGTQVSFIHDKQSAQESSWLFPRLHCWSSSLATWCPWSGRDSANGSAVIQNTWYRT